MNVLFFLADKTGSTYYRMTQPAMKLEASGLCRIGVVEPDQTEDKDMIGKAIAVSDVVVFSRCGSATMPAMIKRIRDFGKKVVFDIDDDFYHVSPFSPHYRLLGTEEVTMDGPEGTTLLLWQDGNTINIEQNKKNLEQMNDVMRAVDLITVTTPYLRDVYAHLNRVAVLPNFVDLKTFPDAKTRYREPYVRLGWRGGWSHYEDLMTVQPVIERLMQNFPVKLVMSGWCPKGFTAKLPADRLEVWPWFDSEVYPRHMMALGIDVAMHPLKDIPFNRGKSELAWLEWSALRVPGVYAAIPPFVDHIRHGDNGMLALSQEGWYESLAKLIREEGTRRRIGNAARRDIEANYDANQKAKVWLDAYDGLFEKDVQDGVENYATH